MTARRVDPVAQSILLIDGSREGADLMQDQFYRGNIRAQLYFVADGEEAIEFLLRKDRYKSAPRPILIFLDMKLANGGGFEMLTLAKADQHLARIPIIVLATSDEGDVQTAYSLHANCCVHRPSSPEELGRFVEFIKAFWLDMISLPS